jgi:hypothetical protein
MAAHVKSYYVLAFMWGHTVAMPLSVPERWTDQEQIKLKATNGQCHWRPMRGLGYPFGDLAG